MKKKKVLIDFREGTDINAVTRVAGPYWQTFMKGEGPFEVDPDIWQRERYLQKLGIFEEVKEKKKQEKKKEKRKENEVKDVNYYSSQI